ncbi:hypothetical protein Dimus_014969 [Dionaea muscipula]
MEWIAKAWCYFLLSSSFTPQQVTSRAEVAVFLLIHGHLLRLDRSKWLFVVNELEIGSVIYKMAEGFHV